MNTPIDIYLDTCDLEQIENHVNNPIIKGFTTNPTLMRRAGVTDYEHFARNLLQVVGDKAVAFEVVTEEPNEVVRQALKIQSWGANVNVKVPLFSSKGDYNLDLICQLMALNVHVNITAMISLYHVSRVLNVLPKGPAILSVFAGRLADTWHPPLETMREAAKKLEYHPSKRLLWASVREVGNIQEAINARCDIITVPPDLLTKAVLYREMDPDTLAVQTSQQFANDAASAGLTL